MTTYSNNAEGGTLDADVTVGNSGGASGDAWALLSKGGAATIKYSATGKAHGNLGIRCVSTGAAPDKFYIRRTLPTLTGVLAERFYFTLNSLPSQAQNIYHLDNGSTQLFALGLLGGNLLRVVNATGATLGQWGTALTAGTLYRLEAQWKKGTTTTDGQLAVQLFAGDSTTALWTYSATNVDVGTLDAQHVYYGDGGTSRLVDITFDDMRTVDAQAAIGPVANTPPTVTVGANQDVSAGATVSLTSTATDVDGSIASRAWSFDFPTSGAPALTGANAANASFTAGAAGSLYILRHAVTDDGGATASATMEVRVPLAGDVKPLPLPGTGAWTNVGGAANGGAALADGLTTTYVEAAGPGVEYRVRLQPMQPRTALDLTWGLVSTSGPATGKLRIYEGTTLRQEWSQAYDTNLTVYTKAVSNPGAIVDWGNISVATVSG